MKRNGQIGGAPTGGVAAMAGALEMSACPVKQATNNPPTKSAKATKS